MEAPFMAALIDRDEDWAKIETWQAVKTAAQKFNPSYLAASVDMKYNADGSFSRQDEERRIQLVVFAA